MSGRAGFAFLISRGRKRYDGHSYWGGSVIGNRQWSQLNFVVTRGYTSSLSESVVRQKRVGGSFVPEVCGVVRWVGSQACLNSREGGWSFVPSHFPQQERVQRRFYRGSFQLSGTQFNILDKIPVSKTSLTPVHAEPWVGEHFPLSLEGTEAGTALCRFQEAAFSELQEGGEGGAAI